MWRDSDQGMRTSNISSCASCILLSKIQTMTFRIFIIILVSVAVTSSESFISEPRLRERRGLSRPPVASYWGEWDSWSACSRTCGGGVSKQTRVCLQMSSGDGGELRQSSHCVGLYKQYKLCNTQPCKYDTDFRQEQCENFNGVPFMGNFYQWRQIEKESNYCELNCQAIGSRFFAKLADKVIDGTSCWNSSTTDVCVDGLCKTIGCDGVLGSNRKMDKCGVCGGTNTQCEVMSGVFTSNMEHGYHKVMVIPTGAMYINITEITKSRNYLALEGTNGNKYINMDWRIDVPGNYSIAGTYFIYKRSPGRTGIGEQFFADGPTTEDLNFIVINQQKNPGIAYEYSLPRSTPIEEEEEIEQPPVVTTPPPRRIPPRVPQRPVIPDVEDRQDRQDPKPPKTQVNGGVSLSTVLGAGQAPVFPGMGKAPVFPGTVQAQKPAELDEDSGVPGQPDRGQAQPERGQGQPDSGRGQPDRGQAQPDRGQAQPDRGQAQPDRGQAQPDRGQAQPDRGRAQPDSGQAQPDRGQAQPDRGQAQPDRGQAQPDRGQAQPDRGQAQPDNGQAQPDRGQAQPDRGQAQPDRGQAQPDRGQAQPERGQAGQPERSGQPTSSQSDKGQSSRQPIRGTITQGRVQPVSVQPSRSPGQPVSGQQQGGGQVDKDTRGTEGGGQQVDSQVEPQADSGGPSLPFNPFRGVETQAREYPDSIFRKGSTGRDSTGAGTPTQGQTYPTQGQTYQSQGQTYATQGQTYPGQGRDSMYPPQGDGVNPERGTGGQTDGRGYGKPVAKPDNPYQGGRYRYTPGQDSTPITNPYTRPTYPNRNPNPNPYPNQNPNPNPNPYPNPNPNPNPNPYPNRNPYPNQNPNSNPSGNQRQYPGTNPGSYGNPNPYPNPNPNPNPYPNPNPNPNPYPNQYPNRYPNNQDSQGGQPPNSRSEQPYLQIDPIESRRGSSSDGSSDYSALESGRYGGRDAPQVMYGWVDAGLTDCSASCAGGIQHTRVDCIHWLTFKREDPSKCDGTRRPATRQIPCNIEPCPPVWEVTEWMDCSRTCGAGRQLRQVSCKQTLTQSLINMVPPDRCNPRLEPARVQECQLKACTAWKTGEWEECDAPCNEGRRHRDVTCINDEQTELEESECAGKTKPANQEICDMGPCISNWFVSEWNDLCSSECGGGHKSRYVVCSTEGTTEVLHDDACNTITKPRTSRTCNNMPCGAVWLTSEWNQCSVECGDGSQTRMVLCAGADEPHIVVNEEQCAMKPKPTDTQPCKLKECVSMWFNSDWTQCSRTCGGGQRKRDVKCLDTNMSPSTGCDESLRPSATQSCNIQQCTTNIPGSDCRDKFPYCEKVAKARLCTYMYYRSNCCYSCFSHSR
ncbi:thrombospondin type-1 domain-containing protein 4-like isoform X1 [Asterias amurensis]|uniref:thrombospondin type-1 domain-containing protein 4-like isoform X1 n=1 Tax=Asterias amurensis TaxID=7602 RepID=UPI003AB34CB8